MFKFFDKLTDSASKSVSPIGIDTDAIKKIQEQTQLRDEKKHNNSGNFYHEALILIKRFDTEKKDSLLRLAASKLDASIKYNRSHGESYFWLAYIFFIFAKYKEAEQYLKVAERFSPDYPQIKQLKQFLVQAGK